jgi:hypothetical protein
VDEQYEGSAEDLARYFLSGDGLRDHEVQAHDHGSGDGTSTSVREFEHRGHRARIETTYRITIDGEPLVGHVEVLPSGQVHYHRFPQYAPSSAVDVVKAVIDTLWEKPAVRDELADGPEPEPGHQGHGEGQHGQGQHGQGEHGQGEHGQGEHGQGEHGEGAQADHGHHIHHEEHP